MRAFPLKVNCQPLCRSLINNIPDNTFAVIIFIGDVHIDHIVFVDQFVVTVGKSGAAFFGNFVRIKAAVFDQARFAVVIDENAGGNILFLFIIPHPVFVYCSVHFLSLSAAAAGYLIYNHCLIKFFSVKSDTADGKITIFDCFIYLLYNILNAPGTADYIF